MLSGPGKHYVVRSGRTDKAQVSLAFTRKGSLPRLLLLERALRASLCHQQFIFRVVVSLSVLASISIGNRAQAQAAPPTITGQPQSLSVSLGANASFRVTAS